MDELQITQIVHVPLILNFDYNTTPPVPYSLSGAVISSGSGSEHPITWIYLTTGGINPMN